MEIEKKKIRSFQDLEIYSVSYQSMLRIFREVLLKLPIDERFDLADQLLRSSKAIPRLIAEGYSKRHQKKGFKVYLDYALAESNETLVSMYQVRDLYCSNVDKEICDELIADYDKLSRQIFTLGRAWSTSPRDFKASVK